jgi:hypothetical protein
MSDTKKIFIEVEVSSSEVFCECCIHRSKGGCSLFREFLPFGSEEGGTYRGYKRCKKCLDAPEVPTGDKNPKDSKDAIPLSTPFRARNVHGFSNGSVLHLRIEGIQPYRPICDRSTEGLPDTKKEVF